METAFHYMATSVARKVEPRPGNLMRASFCFVAAQQFSPIDDEAAVAGCRKNRQAMFCSTHAFQGTLTTFMRMKLQKFENPIF
jgi:hypothetical protein